jgi:hypothetical protein
MRRAVVAAGLGALLLVASLSLLRQRAPVEEATDHSPPTDSVRSPTAGVATDGDAVADRSDAPREPASVDLRGASETFRNSTLLIAIRRAGFYCADVISARESVEGVWVAGCSDIIGYIVTLRDSERFDVHPVPYGDSVTPLPIDRDDSVEPRSGARPLSR